MSATKRARRKKPKEEAVTPPLPLAPPPPKREHRGTPLRPDKFPSVAKVSLLAALLSKEPPKTDAEAQEAARAALRLWRVARDEINKEQAYAEEYWHTIAWVHQGLENARVRVDARLKALGASHLGSKASVTWTEAATALFHALKPQARDGALSQLVKAVMVGKAAWSQWKLGDFKENGFDAQLGFPTLVANFDEIEAARERQSKSLRMSVLAKRSVESKKKKKEEEEYGQLAKSTSSISRT